ncbi:MAG: thiol-activated cytolysin family protein [Prevotellaceae bacterium]|jgi:hypothetical protein|nr:thiol-activated cytolysin family protein [Prevotellaceae bacterium]
MKKLLSSLVGFALLFNACESNIGVDMEALKQQQRTEIADYLNSIGMLDTVPVTEIVEDTISTTQGDAVWLAYPNVNVSAGDYYIPVTIEKQKFGNSLMGNNLSLQSSDVIWPGNLIQGISVKDNQLAMVPLSSYRKPGRIYLDVVSGQEGMNYTHDIPEFTGSCVTQAMNEILAPYTSGFPARIAFSQTFVHSKEEMAFYLDVNADNFDLQTKGAFQSVNWTQQNKTWIMIKLEQIYFTMSYDFLGQDSLFNDDMKAEYLKPYVYENNPLCYLASVSYGRYFVLLYEVDSKNQLIPQTLAKIFSEDSGPLNSNDINSYHTVPTASIRMVQIGGNATDGLETLLGSATALHNFIVNGSVFSKDNVGAPIYYTLRYTHNSRAVDTYKDIDVTYKEMKYYVAEKVNNVEITLKTIYSDRLIMTGGNGHLYNGSTFSVGPIMFYVSDTTSADGWTLIKSIPSKITKVKTEPYAHAESYYQTASTGELGVNTTKRVKMEVTVSYTNTRKIHYIIGSNDYPTETRTYNKKAIFSFNLSDQTWGVTHDNEIGTISNSPFHYLKFTDTFNFCKIGFQLTYEFKANYATY